MSQSGLTEIACSKPDHLEKITAILGCVRLGNLDLSPGQTIEQSWIPHAPLLDVNVEVVAKHYPTLLDETFKFKLAPNL